MTRRQFLCCIPAVALAQPDAASDTATARALGNAAGKFLMVHADDAGMCHSVNIATREALVSKAVSSASVMMPCPWVAEFADFARQKPDLDVGLHLTLTSEWKYYRWRPVTPADKVKGLIDPDGFLWRDVRSVAARASAAEVETELRAQIELARHFGIRFTHLDTHMGTLYARPDYFEVYTKVARDSNVPCMIPRPTAEAAAELRGYPVTPAMLQKKESEGFVLLDRLVTSVPGRTPAERQEAYRNFLRNLRPGVTKLIVHLAKDDEEIRAVTNRWEQRWTDFTFFTSEEARSLMSQHGIQPITYRELGKLAYKL
jgi:predicted glycoside hydrolase/deacetylase ChbG (UPF0249 family)